MSEYNSFCVCGLFVRFGGLKVCSTCGWFTGPFWRSVNRSSWENDFTHHFHRPKIYANVVGPMMMFAEHWHPAVFVADVKTTQLGSRWRLWRDGRWGRRRRGPGRARGDQQRGPGGPPAPRGPQWAQRQWARTQRAHRGRVPPRQSARARTERAEVPAVSEGSVSVGGQAAVFGGVAKGESRQCISYGEQSSRFFLKYSLVWMSFRMKLFHIVAYLSHFNSFFLPR